MLLGLHQLTNSSAHVDCPRSDPHRCRQSSLRRPLIPGYRHLSGYSRKRNVKTAKAPEAPAPAPVPTKKSIPTSLLDTLPSELIELIVEQLRGATSPPKDSAKTPQCRCRMTAAAQRWKNNFKLARAPLETYSDPAWPLACPSRYLRAAVFDNQCNRRIHLSYCQYAEDLT